jgi:hypothetical protein
MQFGEREREREREDGWSDLIQELMRIRWRNIGPPHPIPHRSLFWEQLCSTQDRSIYSLSSLSLSLCERQSERSLNYVGSEERKKREYTKRQKAHQKPLTETHLKKPGNDSYLEMASWDS